MNYIIQPQSARRLKEEIVKRISERAEADGNGTTGSVWQQTVAIVL